MVVLDKSPGLGILLVPIDQTGSYENIILFKLKFFLIEFLIWFLSIKKVFPFFLSLNVSPIQKIIFNFSCKEDSIFFLISLLVSPSYLFF